MSRRESNLQWMRDLLAHLTECQEQLQWTADSETVHVLTESMLRDLDCCRRLTEAVQRRNCLQHAF